ncbi:MAG: hypothetical protein ACRBF0_16280 [Calditrichia bacterium]
MFRIILIASLIMLGLWSCGESDPGSNMQDLNEGRLNIQVRILNASQASTADVVTLNTAMVVLRKIEILDSDGRGVNLLSNGPIIADLASIDTTSQLATLSLPYAEYTEARLSLGPLVSTDGQLYTDNPELQSQSCMVNGFATTLFTRPFEYASGFTYNEEKILEQPIQLNSGQQENKLEIVIDLSSWFLTSEGTFIDPAQSENKDLIDETIVSSFTLER